MMPVYVYHCLRCNVRVDYQLQVIHSAPKHCKREMQRIYTVPNVAFKGEGFTKSTSEFDQIKKLDPDARVLHV